MFLYATFPIDINECDSDPCGKNSTCSNTVGSYDCSCWKGYTPTNSSLPIDKSNPCVGMKVFPETFRCGSFLVLIEKFSSEMPAVSQICPVLLRVHSCSLPRLFKCEVTNSRFSFIRSYILYGTCLCYFPYRHQ